jgi:GT2 family glycosyltransferase
MGRSTSVLIPSHRRVEKLSLCLESLGRQTVPPHEVLVVWQADDHETRDAVLAKRGNFPYDLRALHSAEKGVVVSENVALDVSKGEIVMLIDDDAIAPPEWVSRHAAHYDDPSVGVVGGPADNFAPDRTSLPKRRVEPIGRITAYGKVVGNMHDQPDDWRTREPAPVEHVVGYNMSLRRTAFERFEPALRRYWSMFEVDACLQVRARGFKVLFDFANVVEHFPANTAYVPSRDGDLDVKIYNPAYNHAFVLGKHTPPGLLPLRLAYQIGVGSVGAPGALASALAVLRYGKPVREAGILVRTIASRLEGTRDGRRARRRGGSV